MSEKLRFSLNSGFKGALEIVLESRIHIYDAWHESDIFEHLVAIFMWMCSRKLRTQS